MPRRSGLTRFVDLGNPISRADQGELVMSSRKTWVAGLFTLVLASSTAARTQAQGVGALPGGASSAAASGLAGAAPGLAAPAAAPAAASPTTLWSFLGLSGSNLQACKAKICASQFGQMLNSMATGPVAGMTGGFIPPLCPAAPSASQIAALEKNAPGGAAATAAKIKASEADAKARVAAVEYLATVDCTRWKEATKALINALRADPNECVRYAAAQALNSGCCCNKLTIAALKTCVAGEDDDGNPPETSPRVKAAAFNALQNCLMKVPDDIPVEQIKPPEPERGPGPKLEPIPSTPARERTTMYGSDGSHIASSHVLQNPRLARYEQQMQRKTYAQTVSEARQTLFDVARNARQSAPLPTGRRSVFDIMRKARQDVENAARSNVPPQPVSNDPGVIPSSYTPSADASSGQAAVTSKARTGRRSPAANPNFEANSDDSNRSQGGLAGLLINSRNRVSDQ
jgi:hypothetical protein